MKEIDFCGFLEQSFLSRTTDMQLFLLSKAPFLPVSDVSKLALNLHYLGYALDSMVYALFSVRLEGAKKAYAPPMLCLVPMHL
jgi:hypothetical protein